MRKRQATAGAHSENVPKTEKNSFRYTVHF